MIPVSYEVRLEAFDFQSDRDEKYAQNICDIFAFFVQLWQLMNGSKVLLQKQTNQNMCNMCNTHGSLRNVHEMNVKSL